MLSFSQNTYPKIINDSLVTITNKQLKQTNLIFLEHHKLKQENQELQLQVQLYDSLKDGYLLMDSLQTKKFNRMSLAYDISRQMVIDKELELQKQKKISKTWKTVGLLGIVTTILTLIIKK